MFICVQKQKIETNITPLITFLAVTTSQKGLILTLKGSLVLSNWPWVTLVFLAPTISFSIHTSRVLKSTFPTSLPWKQLQTSITSYCKIYFFYKKLLSVLHMILFFCPRHTSQWPPTSRISIPDFIKLLIFDIFH